MKRTFFAVLTVVALAALVWDLIVLPGRLPIRHGNSGSSSVSVQFPTRAGSNTVVLKAPNSQESLRLVYYAADKVTRTGMRIEYVDGRTGIVEFDTSGKALRFTEYFPLPEGMPWDTDLNKRKLLRVTELLPDGTSVKKQTTYRSSGAIQEFAVRNYEGNLIVTVYDLDMRSVQRLQIFDGNGNMLSERSFYPDGALASSFIGGSSAYGYVQPMQEFYDLRGKRTRSISYSYYSTDVTDYAADGVTRLKTTSYNSWSVTVTSYVPGSNNPAVDKQYRFKDDGSVRSVDVKFYSNGRVWAVQSWIPLDSNALASGQTGMVNQGFVLDTIEEYADNSSSTKRKITYYPGGKTVSTVEELPTGSWQKRTVRKYREDGSLDSIQNFEWSTMTSETKMPPGPNSRREAIAAELLRMEDLQPLPTGKDRENVALPKHQTKLKLD